MDKTAQRIAIAEACGYRFVDEGWRYPDKPEWQKYKAVYSGKGIGAGFIGLCRYDEDWFCCPDYLNDLNAMHEAEKVLNDVQAHEYRRILGSIAVKHQGLKEIFGCSGFDFFAPASQRAEAFLRTLNLWKQEGGAV